MEFFAIKNLNQFKAGKYSIPEPESNKKWTPNLSPTLIITPALAIDKNFYRLGRGKGFYDRFFKKIFSCNYKSISIIPEFAYSNKNFEHDKWDISIDQILLLKKEGIDLLINDRNK